MLIPRIEGSEPSKNSGFDIFIDGEYKQHLNRASWTRIAIANYGCRLCFVFNCIASLSLDENSTSRVFSRAAGSDMGSKA